MNKKDNKVFIAFSIMLLVLIVNIAYAYFVSNKDLKNVDVNVTTTTNLPVFITYSNDDLELNVTAAEQTTPSTTALKTDSAELIVKLSSYEEGKETSCRYSIYYNYTRDVDERTYTLPYDEYNYELSIQGSRVTSDPLSGKSYSNKNLPETDLSNFEDVEEGKILLIDNAEIYSKSLSTATETTWTFTISYYVLPIEQKVNGYGGHLSVEKIACA